MDDQVEKEVKKKSNLRNSSKVEGTEKKEKIPDAELFEAIACAMNGDLSSVLPPFPRKFYVEVKLNGTRQVFEEIEEGSKIVREIEDCAVTDTILQYTSSYAMLKYPAYRWTHKKCAEAMRYWKSKATVLDEILPFAELTEDKWCRQRLPFDLENDRTKMPLAEEFFSRCTNAVALCQFIGSIFHKDSDRQQYVWMYGAGRNGKSALTRILQKVFGSAYQSEDANHCESRFWTYSLIGKRIVVFPDTNSTKFITSGLFKQLTGNDPVRVEEKGKTARTEQLHCKFIFHSNKRPEISSATSDIRRAIFVEVAPLGPGQDEDPEYEDKLWLEAPYILGVCKAMYFQGLGERKRRVIQVEKDALDILVEENELKFEAFFEKHFARAACYEAVRGLDLIKTFEEEGIRDTKIQNDYRDFFQRRYNVIKKQTKKGIVYGGMRNKTYTEKNAYINSMKDIDLRDEQIKEKNHPSKIIQIQQAAKEHLEKKKEVKKYSLNELGELNADGKRQLSFDDLQKLE